MTFKERYFSREELKRFNGKDDSKVYIAYGGKVYDATSSRYWKAGTHMKRHPSGTDLTEELKAAPHGPEVFERLPCIGTLKPEPDPSDERIPAFLQRLLERVPMLRRHPHPMTVHFPLAFTLVIPVFHILYLLSGNKDYEFTAFCMLCLSLIATPVTILTGFYTWWLNYQARLFLNIRVKIVTSISLFIFLIIGFLCRVLHPEMVTTRGDIWTLYISLSFVYPVLVTILGWFGARMTFPA